MNDKPDTVTPVESSDLILVLIREELRSAKLFCLLSEIGLRDDYYRTALAYQVLNLIGFGNPDDELMAFYFEMMDRYSRKLKRSEECLMDAARQVYEALMMRKELAIKESIA